MERREPSYGVGGNVNGYNHYGEQCSFLKKLNIELPYDPTVPLLDTFWRNKCDPKRYMHPSVHCSTVNTNQDMEET